MNPSTASRDALKSGVVEFARQIPNPFLGSPDEIVLSGALSELCDEGELTMVRQYPVRRYVVGRPPAETLADPAPDWGPRYPSGGNLIGPSWQAMWQALAGGTWCDVRDLLVIGIESRGCYERTVRNLLFAAARAHHIEPEARYDTETKRWRMWYRRPDRVADKTDVGV